MKAASGSVIAAAAALLAGGCATADPLEGRRTVFANPYVAPEISRRGIGPQCDVDFGRDATCLSGPLIYSGRGSHASLGNGQSVRLTRAQRRILRERAEALGTPSPPPSAPPPPPVLPTAADSAAP
ncbi:MAG: hypothetical protein GC147_14095 [Porphyrobacter sp.]|nr:hypothetical protein [Porphyrobacter sp.]